MNEAISSWILKSIPDVVAIAIFVMIVVALIFTLVFQIVKEFRILCSTKVTTPENAGLLPRIQPGY